MAGIDNLTPYKAGDERTIANAAKGGAGKKGSKHISTWIQEMLNDEEFTATIRDGIQLKEYKGAPLKAIIGAQLNMAVNGDQKAFDLLSKYGWGIKTQVEHSGGIDTGIADPVLASDFEDYLKNKTK